MQLQLREAGVEMNGLELRGEREKRICAGAAEALPCLLLTALMLGLLLFPVEEGGLFGSEGDWYSQHVGAAEALRQTMLSQETIFPQFVGIGGGVNAYDLAYYGLLRPDVLFSVVFPQIEMKHIISAYAAAGAVAAVNLMYFWLRRKGLDKAFACAGAVVLAGAACFFHAHHQIIFVNYMPFLILALMGVDRIIRGQKSLLLTISVFLICMHSFYYAPTCIVVLLLYGLQGLYELRRQGGSRKEFLCLVGKGFTAAVLGIALAAVLLLPTALDILSTQKDSGSFSEEPIKAVDFSFSGLLYHPYGCGMSLTALYCLLLSLTQKRKRALAAAVCIVIAVPAVWLVLSGFLYPRAKILMPLVPLIAYICADTLQGIYKKEQKPYFVPAVLALLAALLLSSGGKWQPLVYVDGGLLLLWVCVMRISAAPVRVKKAGLAVLLLVPVCVSYGANLTMEDYLAADDPRQSRFSFADITMFASEPNYRFDYLANNYINSNVLPDGALNKTASYTSVTNSLYGEFCYDTMKNPISLRNRVVLMPNCNSLFNYFMGIRYVLTEENRVPAGYRTVFRRNGFVLAENPDVLPICYGTDKLPGEAALRELDFPEKAAALCGVDVREENPRTFFGEKFPRGYGKENSGKTSVSLTEPLRGRILIVSFDVERRDGREVCITINGVKNNLSGTSAPYPNGNENFTFVLSSEEELAALEIEMTRGEYTLENLKVYTADMPSVDKDHVWEAAADSGADQVFAGAVGMKADGYFVTSYPYKKGWSVLVDGKPVEAEKVNTAFMGFALDKGAHRIEIEYTAPGFEAGAAVSLTALAAAALIWAMEYLRERKREE